MNYLGHIYLSDNDHELMIANLFGDFVKGRDLSRFSDTIQKGIILHRKIDFFTDNHKAVKELNKILYPHLPKVAPIAVDLYFDHILAKNWENHHTKDYNNFISEFYNSFENNNLNYPENFIEFLHKMRSVNWLKYYAVEEGLIKSTLGTSRKLSFENKLAEAPEVFYKLEKEIIATFEEFISDAKKEFITHY